MAANDISICEQIDKRPASKLTRAELEAEIASVDRQIAALEASPSHLCVLGRHIGDVSRRVAIASLRHYRQRLARS